MAITTDIRHVLEAGPMRPSEIADALGLTEAADRSTLYKAVAQMVKKERGVEQLDDGRVSLIPGWKPTRGFGAGKAKADKATAEPRKRGRKPALAAATPETPAPSPAAATPELAQDLVTIPRRYLRLLVAQVMVTTGRLEGDLKTAVATAAVLSA